MNDEVLEPPSTEHAKAEAKRYIEGVVDKSIKWYRRHGRRNNFLYNGTRIGIIVLSLSLPAVSVFAKDPSSPWSANLLLVIPVIIAILAALDGFFHWGDLWRSRTSTEITLRRIKREFWAEWHTLSLLPENEQVNSAYDRYSTLVANVESVMRSEEEIFWGRRIQQLERTEKETA